MILKRPGILLPTEPFQSYHDPVLAPFLKSTLRGRRLSHLMSRNQAMFSLGQKIYDLEQLFPLGEFYPLTLEKTTEMRTSKLSTLTYLQTRNIERELTQVKSTSVITQPLSPPAALNIVEFSING